MPPRGRSVMPPAPSRRARPAVRTLAAVALAALPALSACSEPDHVTLDTSALAPASSSAGPSDQAAPVSDPASGPASGPASDPASGPASPTGTDRPTLVLEGDGLGLAVGTSMRRLRFGAARATVVAALTGALGELRSTRLTECGQGPRTQLDRQGFSILVQGTKFVGWTDQGGPGRHLTTADGLGVGSTLGQVRAQFPAIEVSDGSLGPEFSGGHGISGILAGDAPTSKVTTVYAGETCFFR